jgi:hypothetical protein
VLGRSTSFDLLTRIVAEPCAASVAGIDDGRLDRVVELAVAHRVAGSLALALVDAGRALPEPLVELSRSVTANHLLTLAALDRAGRALEAKGLRWAVVKGPVLAARWPGGWTERRYDDLDLLVDPASLGDAIEALRGVGFEHRNTNWEGFRQLGVGEVPLDDGNTVLDLHWSLIGLASLRRDFHLKTKDLLDRAVPMRLSQVEVHTLDPVDTFVHLGVHHTLAGARYLAQLMDIHRVVGDVDPALTIARLDAAGATRLVGAAVDRAQRVFGPAAPRSLAEYFAADRAWRAVNRAADRLWGLVRPGATTPFPGAVVMSGRADRGGTARALLGGVVRSLRPRLGASTLVSDGGPLDWKVHSGGATAYDRFLDEVAEGRYGW